MSDPLTRGVAASGQSTPRICGRCHPLDDWPQRMAVRLVLRPGSTSRFQNQIRNRLRLRYERNVTRLHLDRLGGHSLCHEALEIRIDGPILSRDGVPAWLWPPCRVGGFAGEQGLMKRPLHREERPGLRFRQVAREITQESLLAEASFIAIEYYAG